MDPSVTAAQGQAEGIQNLESCDPVVDALAYYSAVASDGTRSDQEREAAMLFSLAEQQVDNDNDTQGDCELSAREALSQFQKIGSQDSIIDSLRLLVRALGAKAAGLKNSYLGGKQADSVLLEASTLALDEAEKFHTQGQKRGEAAMRLAFAEVNLETSHRQQEVIENIDLACTFCKEIDNVGLQANSTYCQAFMAKKMKRLSEAKELLDKCISLCRSSGNKRCEAQALHLLSVLNLERELFQDCIDASQQALSLYRETGLSIMAAKENVYLAGKFVDRNLPAHAQPHALEALSLLRNDVTKNATVVLEAYLAVVKVLCKRGMCKESLRHAEECNALFRSGDNKGIEALSLAVLADAHVGNRDYKEGLSVVLHAVDLARAAGDARCEADVLRPLIDVHMKMGSWDEAVSCCRAGAGLMQGLQDKVGEAAFLVLLNQVCLSSGDYAELAHTVKELRSLYQQTGDREKEAQILLSEAGLSARHSYEEAMANVKESVEISREIEDTRGIVRGTRVLSKLYRSAGDLESALHAAEDQCECCKLLDDKTFLAMSLRDIAIIQLERENPIQAAKAASEAVASSKKSGDKNSEFESQLMLSNALVASFMQKGIDEMLRGRAKALRPAQEALAIAKKLNVSSHQAEALLQSGVIHYYTGKHDLAMKVANEARAIFHAEGLSINEAEVVMLMANIAGTQGATDKAINRAIEAKALASGPLVSDDRLIAQADELIDRFRPAQPLPGQWIMSAPVQAQQEIAPAKVTPHTSSVVVEAPKEKGLDPGMVSGMVLEVAKNIVGSGDEIELDAALMDSGLDSLSALSFRQSLSQQSGVKLPSSFVFDYPSVREVTDRIVEISKE